MKYASAKSSVFVIF